MGRRKIADELGADYAARLDDKYPSPGVSDFVTYWFPLAHKTLPVGGRAGFVATQAVRDGSSRKASLDYIVDNDGVIFEAVSVMPWSGDAVVHVSIVNWVKGADHAPEKKVLWLNNGQLRLEVDKIASSLRAVTDVRTAATLPQNRKPKRIFQGQTGLGPVCWTRLIPQDWRGKRDDPPRWQGKIIPTSSNVTQSRSIETLPARRSPRSPLSSASAG